MINNNEIKQFVKVMITILPVFMLTILVRLALGYRSIIWFDIGYIIVMFGFLLAYKIWKKDILVKIGFRLLSIYIILAIILPGFEYKGVFITILAELSYLIPIILLIIMLYLKSKIKQ